MATFAQKLKPQDKEKRKNVSEDGKYAKQRHKWTQLDIVRGGGLKPGKLKKCELLSLLKAVAWIAPS